MTGELPAITGKQLIRLFRRDGWEEMRRVRHGIALAKVGPDGRRRITIIPDQRSTLPEARSPRSWARSRAGSAARGCAT
jgi:predicted RNA binding protein YcfA (HicA-like mRNA interferase family)